MSSFSTLCIFVISITPQQCFTILFILPRSDCLQWMPTTLKTTIVMMSKRTPPVTTTAQHPTIPNLQHCPAHRSARRKTYPCSSSIVPWSSPHPSRQQSFQHPAIVRHAIALPCPFISQHEALHTLTPRTPNIILVTTTYQPQPKHRFATLLVSATRTWTRRRH